MDYRFSHKCKKCGGNIQLPAWHALLYIGENVMFVVIGVKLNLGTWQIWLGIGLLLLFMWFVQLPFIPIRG